MLHAAAEPEVRAGPDLDVRQQPRRRLRLIVELPVLESNAGRDRYPRRWTPAILRPTGGRPGIAAGVGDELFDGVRESAIDSPRIERLRLRAELEQVAGARIPLRAAPPRDVAIAALL